MLCKSGLKTGNRNFSEYNLNFVKFLSVESAISVAEKALYDIDHPLPGSPTKSIEVQQEIMKERAFYEAFLEKLKNL